jgi:tetratricopeptide (TPR) repeat protein
MADPSRLIAAAQKSIATGDWPAAIEAFRGLLALAPAGSAALHYNLGLSLRRAGRDEEALPQFDQALMLDPAHAAAAFERSAALMQLGRWNEAADGFAACLARTPDDADARLNLARLLISLDQWAEAKAILAPLLADARASHLMAEIESATGSRTAAATARAAAMADIGQRASLLKALSAAPAGRLPLSWRSLLG